jgi:arylsulfatase
MNLQRVAAWSLLTLAFLLPARGASANPPNIIFILTDDQGYGDLSCHGNPILKTPHLDRLHRESVRFTTFQVSPTCSPTRCSLMTGRHEFRSGVTHTFTMRCRMSLKATTIAQLLKAAGYSTGIFGKWHLGDAAAYQPDRRGFDEVFIHGAGGIGQGFPGSTDVPGNKHMKPTILHNRVFEKTRGYCTDVFFDQATKWIGEVKGRKPFFAYIACNDPHDPQACPEEFARPYAAKVKPRLAKYFGMVSHIDDNVGRLLAQLKTWDLERDTLLIFMTDNGGITAVDFFNAGMGGRKGTPHEGGTRVPSFWRWPAGFKGGVDVDQLAAGIDVFPTLVEVAGAKVPKDVKLDGRSLVPLLKNPKGAWPDRFVFVHVGRWAKGQAARSKFTGCAVRSNQFRFVNNRELYDMKADPAQKKNVIGDHPKIVAKMRAAYDKWWKEILPALENEDAAVPAVEPFPELYKTQMKKP